MELQVNKIVIGGYKEKNNKNNQIRLVSIITYCINL